MDERPQPPADAGRPMSGPDTMPADDPLDDSGPPPPPPPPQPAPEQDAPAGGAGLWQLRRSLRDRKLKGVAGGVAAAADVDPTLIRLLFAVAAFSGWGIVAYIVLAVVLKDESVEDPARPLARDQRRMLRVGLAVAAAVAVGRLFGGWFSPGGDMGLPFLLIAVGAAVLWARRDQSTLDPAPPGAPIPSPGDPLADPAGIGAPPLSWPVPGSPPPLGAGIDWRSTGHDLLRLAAAFVAVGALLALLGTSFLVAVGAVPMRLPLLPAAVATLGLIGLVVAVVRRGRLAALVLSGGVLLAAVALAAGLTSFPDGAGTRVVTVGPGTPLAGRYEQGAGSLTLDLAGLTLEPEEQRRVVAEVGAGELTVIVPPSLRTAVTARVGAGSTTLFGRTESGPGVDVDAVHAGEGAARLDLDLDVGVGQINVELAREPTSEVRCTVPADAKGDGTDLVTCPHPARLVGTAMSCSVVLADPDGGREVGRAFCRRSGSPVPVIGVIAASCEVPADDVRARCGPLRPDQLTALLALRAAPPSSPSTTTGPAPNPSTTAAPAPGGSPLSCGPPDSAGVRTCTTTPAASTSTTASAPGSYRCTEDPATRQLSCVPA